MADTNSSNASSPILPAANAAPAMTASAEPMTLHEAGPQAAVVQPATAPTIEPQTIAPLAEQAETAFGGFDIMDGAQNLNFMDTASGRPMAGPVSAAALALNGGAPVDTRIAALNLSQPAAGKTQMVHVQPGQTVATAFNPDDADLQMQGKDLVLQFKDGGKIVLQDFAADTQHLPNIALPDGSLIAGGVIVAQLQGTENDIFSLQTAAGGTDSSSGQANYSDDFGTVTGLLDKLPPLGFSALAFGVPQPQVFVANDLIATPVPDPVGGTFTTTLISIVPDLPETPNVPGNPNLGGVIGPVAVGFEDWTPGKNIGDTTQVPLALQITFTPSDNEVVNTVTISNFPAGVQFFFGTPGNYTAIPVNPDGSITFTGAQLATNNIFVLPPTRSDSDIPMTITLAITDPDNGLTAIISQNTVAVIDAVADRPELTGSVSLANGPAGSSATGAEENQVNLNADIKFADNDGSEIHTVILSGVPKEWTPVPGVFDNTFTGVLNADGTVTYTGIVTGNINGTIVFNTNNWSSKNGDANLVLTARATEKVTDGELTNANNVAEINLPFKITIIEDVPTLFGLPAPAVLAESALLVPGIDSDTSNIKVEFHTDGPGNVQLTVAGLVAQNLTSHGQALNYILSADGKTITATNPGGETVFTVALQAPITVGIESATTIPYTFTLLQPVDHPAGNDANILTIPVNFIATDSDGDSIGGIINLNVIDGIPTAQAAELTLDETGDLGKVLSGTLDISFGPDGAGTVQANNIFSSNGSKENGVLSSNGVPVIVTLENGVYVGKANGATVFTMTINANGTYSFVQNGPLDHADGNNPNDVITLNFGYGATDFDGDTASNTLSVRVLDDAPVTVNDTAFIPNGSDTATGNILSNDDLSNDTPNTVQKASVNGVTKFFDAPDGTDAGGKFVLLTGIYGTLKLYENGQYTYTYDVTKHQGTLTERFDYTLIDHDGDTSSTPSNSGLVVTIVDNGPDVAPNVTVTVDETTLDNAVSGTLSAPDAVSYTLLEGFNSEGSKLNNALTSKGVPVVVTLENGQYVGKANGIEVFTLTVNANGAYNFVQKAVLDHADGSNPDDTITLRFYYRASDADGDSAIGHIIVHVRDDAPTAVNDTAFIPNGSTNAIGNILANDKLSNDMPNVVQKASVNGVTKSFDVPDGMDAGGKFITLTGTYGTLKLYENGQYNYKYDTANHNGNLTERFDYTIVDGDGDTSSTANNSGLVITIVDNGPGNAPDVTATVDETTLNNAAGGTITATDVTNYTLTAGFSSDGSKLSNALTSNGVPVTVTIENGQYVGRANGVDVFNLTLNANGTYSFVQKSILDHADGSNPNDVIHLHFAYAAKDVNGETITGTINVAVLDDAPIAVNDVANVPNGSTVATGNILSNDDLSNDMPNTVQKASVNGVMKSFDAPDGTDGGGKFITLTGSYGTLKLYENGQYTYQYDAANHQGNLTERFDYTIVDHDGDTSSTSNNSGLVITIIDNGPGTAPDVTATVDETNLNNAVGGTLAAPDAVSYALVNGFTSDGSKLNNTLTSKGVPVIVTIENGQYVGKANGVEVFTLTLNANGAYNFVQKAVLDHADGSNPDDVITLHFDYAAKDADGDSAVGRIIVNVRDDAPTAIADSNTVNNATNIATGNVIDNDILSHDAPNLLKDASYAGTTKSFAAPDGTDAGGKYVILNGAYGQLKIYENGQYTYNYNPANHGNLTEKFGYTLVDFDGDTSTTSGQIDGQGLTILITDGVPSAQPTFVGVDETDTLDRVFNGAINASFGSDGAGSVQANGSFESTGSKTGGALSSHGVPVVVTYENGQYIGKANGNIVFTMTINADATYSFVQKAVLDHADGNNINDSIDLNFGYSISDKDGDTANSIVTVRVVDDAPIAIADTNRIENGQTVATGNVLNNDVKSHDAPNLLQSVSFANTTKSFAAPDGTDGDGKYLILNGTYGQLKIYENGQHTYHYDTANHNGNLTEQFGYTMVDFDGDTSSTSGLLPGQGLTITIIDNGPGNAPDIFASVDETNLNNAATGTINAGLNNYHLSDNSFSSDGSKLNGNLTSNGSPVNVSLVNGQYVGTANGQTVFTLILNGDGSYRFNQSGVLDHADGNNPNDAINLHFNYNASNGNGENITGTLHVQVIDDAPIAVDDTGVIPNGSTVAQGNILNNDDLSNDAPNTVLNVSINNVVKSFSNPDGTDGGGKYVILNGTYGQLKLYDNGQYTYTYDTANHNGNLTERFDYTIVDRDGDTSSTGNNTGLVITITDNGPGNAPDVFAQVDETNLNNAANGNIDAGLHDYRLSDNSFSSDGSKLNGNLTSNGSNVAVTIENGQYVGKVGDRVIFTLALNLDGSYSFIQREVLDHADSNNPNDAINLHFNYNGYNGNGENITGTLHVQVIDDAPIAINDTAFIPNGSTVVQGNILSNDDLSNDNPNTVLNVSINNLIKSFNNPDGADGGGRYVIMNGTYGQLKLYENGQYTYTYDTTNHNGNLTERFDYTIIDRDGDTSSTGNNTGLVITITDNGPGNAPDVFASVDETNLNNAANGNIDAGLHDYRLSDNSFSSDGSKLNGNLTSNGSNVAVGIENGQYVGKVGDRVIFTLTLNLDGSYSFVQKEVLDHADGSNPNDAINLRFNYNGYNGNGENVTGTLHVQVIDDAPIAIDDAGFIPNGSTSVEGNLLANDDLSNDSPTRVLNVFINATVKSFDSPDGADQDGRFVLMNGTYGQLKLYENGKYIYNYDIANHNGNLTERFDYTIVDSDGDTSRTGNNTGLVINIVDDGPGNAPTIEVVVDETNLFNEQNGSINMPGGNQYTLGGFNADGSLSNNSLTSHGVPVTVNIENGQYVGRANGNPVFTLTLENNGNYHFVQTGTLDHNDGNNPDDVINLHFGYSVRNANGENINGVINVQVVDDAPTANPDFGNVQDQQVIATGNILQNDRMSNDGTSLFSVTFNGNSVTFQNNDPIVINGNYGQLTVFRDGSYTYTYNTANHNGNNTDRFDYMLVDGDGDWSRSTLTIDIVDNGPGNAPDVFASVDETDMNNAANGSINAGLNDYRLSDNSFSSDGSKLNGNLTSNGSPVSVTVENGQYVGRVADRVIFTLTLNSDGSYSFVQREVLDHADGNNPNDAINLHFNYNGNNGNGENITGTIHVQVADDAPIAIADSNGVSDGGTTASGNVLNNDDLSNDHPNVLEFVSINGNQTYFGDNNTITVNGNYGQLVISKDGSYTYNYDTNNHNGNNTDQFTYGIIDRDGDRSATTLTINITDNPGQAPSLNIDGGHSFSQINVQTMQPNTVTMPELIEMNNINCTPAEFDRMADRASNMFNLGFPSVISIQIEKSIQQSNSTNGMGAFTVNPDGSISNVQLLFGSTGNALSNGNSSAVYDTLSGQGKVVFFIVSNGFDALKSAGLAQVDGTASQNLNLSMERQGDGSLRMLYVDGNGKHYLDSTIYASDQSFNSDGQVHAVAGSSANLPGDHAIYAFEDAHGPYDFFGSDRDFNDVVFSVSAQPFVNVGTDNNNHLLFDNFNISDVDSSRMSEALIEIRSTQNGDALRFDFGGTGYSLVGNNLYKNGSDTGIDAVISRNGSGNLEVHVNGDGATDDYNAIMKALHFDVGSNNGDRYVDVTITDDSHQSSFVSTVYQVDNQLDLGRVNVIESNIHQTLIGGTGNDTLTGGNGADSFMFLKAAGGIDHITDYHKYEGDRLDISDLLSGSNYTPGADTSKYVKIDAFTGDVFVDRTGSGHFDNNNHVATIDNIFSVESVNVLLHDQEGNKVIHTV